MEIKEFLKRLKEIKEILLIWVLAVVVLYLGVFLLKEHLQAPRIPISPEVVTLEKAPPVDRERVAEEVLAELRASQAVPPFRHYQEIISRSLFNPLRAAAIREEEAPLTQRFVLKGVMMIAGKVKAYLQDPAGHSYFLETGQEMGRTGVRVVAIDFKDKTVTLNRKDWKKPLVIRQPREKAKGKIEITFEPNPVKSNPSPEGTNASPLTRTSNGVSKERRNPKKKPLVPEKGIEEDPCSVAEVSEHKQPEVSDPGSAPEGLCPGGKGALTQREANPKKGLTKEEKRELKEHYHLGKRYYLDYEEEKAIQELERVLYLNPTHQKAIKYLIKSRYSLGKRYYRDGEYEKALLEFEKVLEREPGHSRAEKYLTKLESKIKRRVTEEVVAEKPPKEVVTPPEMEKPEVAVPEKVKVTPPKEVVVEEPWVEEEVKEKVKVTPPKKEVVKEPLAKKEIKEEIKVIPPEEVTVEEPLVLVKEETEIISSTDVINKVEVIEEEGKIKIIISLSGEREYRVSEESQPPAIIVDIPHTISALPLGRIVVNKGKVRRIEVGQYRSFPFDEARVRILLTQRTEYEVKTEDNKIYIEFD